MVKIWILFIIFSFAETPKIPRYDSFVHIEQAFCEAEKEIILKEASDKVIIRHMECKEVEIGK